MSDQIELSTNNKEILLIQNNRVVRIDRLSLNKLIEQLILVNKEHK